MKTLLTIIAVALSLLTPAQVVRQPLSVHYAGLGAYSQNFSDIFSGTSNEASLAGLKTAAFGIYAERRFMLEELNALSAVAALPTKSGTVGVQVDYFGSQLFNESQASLIYARKITSQVDVGAKFNYHSVRVSGYGAAASINFDLGAIFHVTDRFHTGIHLYNPGGSKFNKTGTGKLGSVYIFGLGYEASDKLFVSTEIEKQEDRPAGVIAGLQYNLEKRVFIRGGVNTGSNNSYLSVGLDIGIGRIDVNTAYHPQLGFSPGILLILKLKKPSEE